MTEIALPPTRSPRIARPPVGLLLSIGAEKPEGGPGRPIDWIRAKPGKVNQFQAEAAKFGEVYGHEPHSIDDIYFLVNDVPTVLQIRLTAFSQTGIRGFGQTNYAALPPDEFLERAWGYQDEFLFFPKDATEVRAELRDSWEGEPIAGVVEGRDDPKVERLGIKLTASLEFCLPQVMGLGKVARISTGSRNSIRNLYSATWDCYEFFGNRLMGIPFRLALRPKPTQRFDAAKKAYTATTVYELILDTPLTIAELSETLRRRQEEFGIGTRESRLLESRMMTRALALPAGPDEREQTRDEPEPESPSDALLNRLAGLLDEAGAGGLMILRGVFGADSAVELGEEDAERLEAMLLAALPAEAVEGEIVEDTGQRPATEPEVRPATSSGESGPTQISAGAGLGEDEPAPSLLDESVGGVAPVSPSAELPYEEEPEPGTEDWGATVIPGNLRMSGQTLAEVYEATKHADRGGSIGWALRRNPDLWPAEFRVALAAFALDKGIEP